MRKNCFRLLSLTVLAVAVTSISTFAADAEIQTETDPEYEGKVTLAAEGAEKVNVTYSEAESGKEYLIMVQSDNSDVPTEGNLVYIDQKTADGTAFIVYPKEMKDGTTYHVYLSSNATRGITTRQKVGTFEYTSGIGTTINGDINGDGSTDISDALMILNHIVGNTTLEGDKFSAADIVKDGTIDINDALKLLNYIVGNINTLS